MNIRYLAFTLISFAFLQCVNHKETSSTGINRPDTTSRLIFQVDTSSGDTVSVFFVLSGLEYDVHYYRGKPQYVRIKKFENKSPVTFNYRRDSRGVFVSLDDQENILAFGCNYLNGNEKAAFHLDSIGKMKDLELYNDHYIDTPYNIDLTKILH
jgi:hypothetical protein